MIPAADAVFNLDETPLAKAHQPGTHLRRDYADPIQQSIVSCTAIFLASALESSRYHTHRLAHIFHVALDGSCAGVSTLTLVASWGVDDASLAASVMRFVEMVRPLNLSPLRLRRLLRGVASRTTIARWISQSIRRALIWLLSLSI